MRRFAWIAVASLTISGIAAAAVPQRAFVSTAGNDANAASGCALTAPCRSFDAAIGVVAFAGEVIALDSGGYGRFTVNKSVSVIAAPGVYAAISVFSATNGIDINTAGIRVVLRGLTINGQGGTHGINFADGDTLLIDSCVVNQMTGAGVLAIAPGPSNNPAKVQIVNSVLSNNGIGLALDGGPVSVTLSRTTVNGNNTGIDARSSASPIENVLVVQASTISDNHGFGILIESNASGSIVTSAIADSTISNNNDNGIYTTGVVGSQSITRISGNSITGNFNGVSTNSTGTQNVVIGENSITRNRSAGVIAATTSSRGDNTIAQNIGPPVVGPLSPLAGQ